MDIKKLIDSAAALPPFYADVCMLAADEIKALRAKLEDPDLANLRCLEGSVKSLISIFVHPGSILWTTKSDGTISGDLYAAVSQAYAKKWDNDTLSDLRRRYPLPRPIAELQAGPSGNGELPGVPCEVRHGGGSAVDRGVCGPADVGTPVSTAGPWNYGEEYQRDVMAALMAKPGSDETWYHLTAKEYEKQIEQARSTTRRNIVQAIDELNTGVPSPGLPQQDIAIALAVLRKAVKDENEAERNVQKLERHLIDMSAQLSAYQVADDKRELVLRQAIKSRDGQIKSLNAQVDKLARHIAFGVMK